MDVTDCPRRVCRRPTVLAGAMVTWLLLAFVAQLVMAGPTEAHAELLASSPRNGERLLRAPSEVTLRFTEPVTLTEGGLRLLDAHGRWIHTPRAAEAGSTVHWKMPVGLPEGAYVAHWRVVSDDGHPVSGSLSFGVGVAAAPVDRPAGVGLSWPVTVARLGGYVGFILVAGVIALTLVCWPEGREESRTHNLLRIALLLGAVSTLAALLLQGPYAAGEPLTRLFNRSLMAEVAHTSFGAWTQFRLYVFLALTAVLWPLEALEATLNRWIAGVGVVAAAATYSGTGHAAATGVAGRVVDSLHVLAAGIWVGGLLALLVAAGSRSARPTRATFMAFSMTARLAVVALVATGGVNALQHLGAPSQLWRTGYGQVLAIKVVLVALALSAAVASRRVLHRGRTPWSSVRVEAVIVLMVVAATSVLASTPPPARLSTPSSPHPGEHPH